MKRSVLPYFVLLLLPFQISGQACTMANYMAAVRIPITSFPYVATSAPTLTVSAVVVGCPTLGNSTYNCGPDSYGGASPAWWLNAAAPGQSITFNFSSPVTSLTYLVNGTNSTEEFYVVSNGTCAISLSNYCSIGYTAVGGTLTAGPTAALGSIITVNNPGGATQYIMTHNGLGAGSRVTLLDCFTKGTGACVLPVELSSFNAFCNSGEVDLNWKTSSEKNNDYFTVERSRDGAIWQAITEIEGAGTSESEHNYSFTDARALTGLVYYRLKQTDHSKQNSYSQIVSVNACNSYNTDEVEIYPNPSGGEFNVTGAGNEAITIFDAFGHKILEKEASPELSVKIDVSSFEKGIYFLKIGGKNYKLVKQ